LFSPEAAKAEEKRDTAIKAENNNFFIKNVLNLFKYCCFHNLFQKDARIEVAGY
jgi:hypothetical protein